MHRLLIARTNKNLPILTNPELTQLKSRAIAGLRQRRVDDASFRGEDLDHAEEVTTVYDRDTEPTSGGSVRWGGSCNAVVIVDEVGVEWIYKI